MNFLNIKSIKRALMIFGALCVFINVIWAQNSASPQGMNTFTTGEKTFLLNGNPFIIKAAELHYPRIPREYWDQRIKMCKALGMNTICLYTFWNVHESTEGIFDFSGNSDIAAFINLCAENGMYVILRPGPYVCAEWEMGGLPWWLLKKHDIKLRDSDPYFLERVKLFEEALAAEVGDLTIDKGGPIIMIQVENEYGAYGENKEYVATIRDFLRELYGDQILMFQCDWASNFQLNGLDDLVWTMNFGTGTDIDSQFEAVKKLRPTTPLMCSEFWSGWFDKWGAQHETRPAEDMIAGIDEMLSKGISFSLYMTHGGTNWGHWAGANSPGYAPDVTSYDYDAPINENGNPTRKYRLLRETLQKYSQDSLPQLPELIIPGAIDKFEFTEIAPLWNNFPEPELSYFIKPMEDYNQGYGSIMYSSKMPEIPSGAVLHVIEPHDYAQVFINGNFIGKLDRRLGETQLILPESHKGDQLDILVEAMGRINFGVAIKDYKGITDNVYFTLMVDNVEVTSVFDYWDVYLLPDELEFYQNMTFQPLTNDLIQASGRLERGVYRAKFNVEKPCDTFLNFETWGKGLVYVNGHALGRIWDIGPQQTLYTPGVWLKEGENEILVFDIVGPWLAQTEGLQAPIINQLQGEALQPETSPLTLDLGNLSPVFGGAFPQGNGWKRQEFVTPEKGRYLVIEIVSVNREGEQPAIAEFYALNAKGERIDREKWTIAYVDSEDTLAGNNTASKIFDLQESTYWMGRADGGLPQRLVIDMGEEENVAGIEYLPRQESGAPGSISEYQIYVSPGNPLK